jgi:pyrimidine-nucleoside phosphorylase
MRVVDIIRKKRDGAELTHEEISFLVSGYARDEIPDYQVSAWLMALFLKGMSRSELAALTEAMLRSGEILDLSCLPGSKVDKHSTGGVGDKTSLVIAPVAAAGGLLVPMISGRGLGHTGGTLDKLESIPGFNVNLSLADFRRALSQCGCAMIGQTAEIAPADKRLYALRDVTATVDNQNLICASIMSKKLAEGIDALVLDVKTGAGAFMKEEKDALVLAGLMVETGMRMGKQVVALITDMDQPLGRAVGNALEVAECIDVLRGGGPADLRALCIELAGWMFCLGRRTAGVEEGKRLAAEIIDNGRGLGKFHEIIGLQGGDPGVTDDPGRLPQSPQRMHLPSPANGYVAQIACEQIGVAAILLGGGRERKEDVVDPAVGIVLHKKIGDGVSAGEPLLTVHYRHEELMAKALALLEKSFRIAAEPPGAPRPLVRRVLDGRSTANESSGGR